MLARFFAIISVASLPLTNVFALGQFSTIPFLSAVFAAFLGLASGEKINRRVVIFAGFFPLALLVIGFISFGLDNGGAHADGNEVEKSFRTHILLLVYACSLGVVHKLLNFKTILKWVTVGIVFSSTFGLTDFFLQNFTTLSLDHYFYRYSVTENTGSLAGIWRVRATFAEPGHFAFYLAILAPWALKYIKNKRNVISRRLFKFILAASFLLTFSAAGYFILVFLTLLIAIRERKMIWLLPSIFALAAIVSVPFFEFSGFSEKATVFLTKYGENYGQSENVSLIDRTLRIEAGIDMVKDAWLNENMSAVFFGYGPGWLMSNFGTGLVNVYLYLLVEFGLLGLISLIVYFAAIWWNVVRRQDSLIFYSFFAMIITFAMIQNYYDVMVIFVFSLWALVPTKIIKKNTFQANQV